MKIFRQLIARQREALPHRARFILQWHITHRCDHRCAHCYQERFDSAELPVDRLLEVAGQFSRFLAVRQSRHPDRIISGQLTITGGEPLLYPAVRALLSSIRTEYRHLHRALLTNGSLIDPATAEWLSGIHCDFIQVSLEGSEATHDSIRGAGDYQRVIKALQNLRKAGVRTMVSFTAHQGNYREFPAVVQAGQECGAMRVWSDRWLPLGGAAAGYGVLSRGETRAFFTSMDTVRRKGAGCIVPKTEVAMHRALQFLIAGGRPYSCQAGRNLLAVMPNGDVYPCRRLPVSVGNVFQQPLETIYEESPLLRRLRSDDAVPAECRTCFYAQACRGGLRCLSHAITGDPFRKDPGCWFYENPIG